MYARLIALLAVPMFVGGTAVVRAQPDGAVDTTTATGGEVALPRNTFELLSLSAGSDGDVRLTWRLRTPDGNESIEAGRFSLQPAATIHGNLAMLALLRDALASETSTIHIAVDPATAGDRFKTVIRASISR